MKIYRNESLTEFEFWSGARGKRKETTMDQEHAYRRHLAKDEIARASYNWTEPVKPGPVHSATADYLELDRSIWVGTTIDNDGYREDYITDKVLYELVEQLAEDLAAAKTDKDRDRLLDRHLDVLDAW